MSKNSSHSRAQWGSHFGFLMAAVGSAIGLGNLWRFPYLVGSYGGAVFVILYLVLLLIIGVPLMLTEITIGQYGKTDPYGSYIKVSPRIGVFGHSAILCAFLILSYYGTIGGWVTYYTMVYLFSMFGGPGIPAGKAVDIFTEMISRPGTAISWHLIFMLSCIIIVLGGLDKGTERANKVMMPALFIILLVLAFVSMSFKGATAGLDFYLKPDFSKMSLSVAGEALGQVFFSLSLGMGAMLTYGSYLKADQSAKRNSVLIPSFDTMAALLAGFVIFPAVFAVGMEPTSGAGLVFATLPEVFNKLPAGDLIGFLFFITVFFAAASSNVSLLEVVVAYFIDQNKTPRKKAIIGVGVTATVLGILPALSQGNGPLAKITISSLFGSPEWMSGIRLLNLAAFDLLDYITGRIMLPLGGLALCITGGWLMGKEKLLSIITKDGERPFKLAGVYFFIVKYIAPIAILIVFIQALSGS